MTDQLPNLYPTLSRPLDDARVRVVSFGAGVQSTTMLLMAAHGAIGPVPDYAIFADTEDEPREVYDHLGWVTSSNVGLPFEVLRVSAGNIRREMLDAAAGVANAYGRPPLYIRGDDGRIGITNRQCTQDYKIEPIERKLRELLGLRPRQRWPRVPVVEQWIGISTDEIGRLKPSRRDAVHNRHPLVEIGYSRRDCLRWLEENGYPRPPKSACRICPFRSQREWQSLRDRAPDDFASAVEVDEAIRGGLASLNKGTPYLHRSATPLREAVDVPVDDPRQSDWLGECEGACGV